MSCRCILYCNYIGWSRRNSWSCCILFGGLIQQRYFRSVVLLVNIVLISCDSMCLSLWYRADRLWWVFGYRSLWFNLHFLEQTLCSLGSSSLYKSLLLLMALALCWKQRTIPVFTLYRWWELKFLRQYLKTLYLQVPPNHSEMFGKDT